MSEAHPIKRNKVIAALLCAAAFLLLLGIVAPPANAQRIECGEVDIDGTVVTRCMMRPDDAPPADGEPDQGANSNSGIDPERAQALLERGGRQNATAPDVALFERPSPSDLVDDVLENAERPDKSREPVPDDADDPANDYAEAITGGVATDRADGDAVPLADDYDDDDVFDSAETAGSEAGSSESASGLAAATASAMEPHLGLILFAWVALLFAGATMFGIGRLRSR